MIKLWFSRNLKKAIDKIMLLFEAVDTDMDNFESVLNGIKEKTISTSLENSKWNEGEYSFETNYPSSTYNLTISFDYDIGTAVQEAAYIAANIKPSKTNKVYAKGIVPSIDIPIVLKVRNK